MANPSGCAYCGIDLRGHFQRWTPFVGWHGWRRPTQEQVKARMVARRADRIMRKAGA